MRAIQITRFGGPEVLTPAEVPDPAPADGAEVVDVLASGVNYADTHQIEDSYLARQQLPLIPGAEVVGRRADGTRVVALTLAGGGYAEKALVHPAATFGVPDGVTDGEALALVLQGTTAWHVLKTSAHLAPGETVVVHAAAGGVGTLAVQLAKAFGAGRVIATASSPDKRDLALSLGADVAVDPAAGDLTAALREAGGGRPVDVVLEMAGGPVFDASLAALAPFGRLVTYGLASRVPPTPVNPAELMGRSRAVLGFWLVHAITRPGMLAEAMAGMFEMVRAGTLRPIVGGEFPLAEARRAHEELLARRSTGKLVLIP
ncbi:MAG: NADPH:quinone oxidoreductase family protein [Mycobacterium sp.]|nr:NADPH:quinone oxidoreductase family protein [Mycobacterium sp.]